LVVGVAVTIAAIMDVRSLRVYNALTFPLLATGILFHILLPWGQGAAHTLCGAGLGFGVLFLFFLMGGIGAGDVKLLAGVGAWLGPVMTFVIFVITGLAAGLYSLVVILKGEGIRETWDRCRVLFYQVVFLSRYFGAEDSIEDLKGQMNCRARVIPFAAMVCVATFLLVCGLIVFAWT
jgi:prepilin peptidase CpaA